MFVIMKGALYVARPGSKKSYTRFLQNARTFRTRQAASADACGNERVVNVLDLPLAHFDASDYFGLPICQNR